MPWSDICIRILPRACGAHGALFFAGGRDGAIDVSEGKEKRKVGDDGCTGKPQHSYN